MSQLWNLFLSALKEPETRFIIADWLLDNYPSNMEAMLLEKKLRRRWIKLTDLIQVVSKFGTPPERKLINKKVNEMVDNYVQLHIYSNRMSFRKNMKKVRYFSYFAGLLYDTCIMEDT